MEATNLERGKSCLITKLENENLKGFAASIMMSWMLGAGKDLGADKINDHWFLNLHEACTLIEHWRQDYNSIRPHGAIGYLTPAQFAANYQFKPEDSTHLCG